MRSNGLSTMKGVMPIGIGDQGSSRGGNTKTIAIGCGSNQLMKITKYKLETLGGFYIGQKIRYKSNPAYAGSVVDLHPIENRLTIRWDYNGASAKAYLTETIPHENF